MAKFFTSQSANTFETIIYNAFNPKKIDVLKSKNITSEYNSDDKSFIYSFKDDEKNNFKITLHTKILNKRYGATSETNTANIALNNKGNINVIVVLFGLLNSIYNYLYNNDLIIKNKTNNKKSSFVYADTFRSARIIELDLNNDFDYITKYKEFSNRNNRDRYFYESIQKISNITIEKEEILLNQFGEIDTKKFVADNFINFIDISKTSKIRIKIMPSTFLLSLLKFYIEDSEINYPKFITHPIYYKYIINLINIQHYSKYSKNKEQKGYKIILLDDFFNDVIQVSKHQTNNKGKEIINKYLFKLFENNNILKREIKGKLKEFKGYKAIVKGYSITSKREDTKILKNGTIKNIVADNAYISELKRSNTILKDVNIKEIINIHCDEKNEDLIFINPSINQEKDYNCKFLDEVYSLVDDNKSSMKLPLLDVVFYNSDNGELFTDNILNDLKQLYTDVNSVKKSILTTDNNINALNNSINSINKKIEFGTYSKADYIYKLHSLEDKREEEINKLELFEEKYKNLINKIENIRNKNNEELLKIKPYKKKISKVYTAFIFNNAYSFTSNRAKRKKKNSKSHI